MREILFRGRRKDNNAWVFGGYSHCAVDDTHFIVTTGKDHISYIERHQDVDPDTVGQYIEMMDHNGTKIFEGDIVRGIGCAGESVVEPVEYRNGECFPFDYLLNKACDVVGNIYDNPEFVGSGLIRMPISKSAQKVIRDLGHPFFPEEYIESCLNSAATIKDDPQGALSRALVNGYLAAVTAIVQMNERRQKNGSIPLDKLFEMVKKPVWLEPLNGAEGCWVLLKRVFREDEIYDSPHFQFVGTKREYYLDSEEYGKTWRARAEEPIQ